MAQSGHHSSRHPQWHHRQPVVKILLTCLRQVCRLGSLAGEHTKRLAGSLEENNPVLHQTLNQCHHQVMLPHREELRTSAQPQVNCLASNVGSHPSFRFFLPLNLPCGRHIIQLLYLPYAPDPATTPYYITCHGSLQLELWWPIMHQFFYHY